MRRAPIIFLSILFITITTAACSGVEIAPAAETPYGKYEIDPIFWAYFKQNGGTDVFGPVLTTIFSNEAGEKLQYLESGLLVYDPSENQFSFAPLGIELNLGEPPEDRQTQSGDLVLNGYLVHPALVDFYLDLGRELVGAPISNPYYNYAKNRLEQHFENLGIYYMLDDPRKTPHLLAYGLLDCDSSCQAFAVGPIDGKMTESVTDGTFINFLYSTQISRSLLGDVVVGPILLNDGTTQMIFDNLVLASSGGPITILNTPQLLGLSTTDLFPEIQNSNLIFIPLQGSLGHNVFTRFNEFIQNNGGYAVSGLPTTEIFTLNIETNVIRQCFTHICLDYYPDALEANVRPARLGWDYLTHIQDSIIDLPNDGYNEDPFTTTVRQSAVFSLHVWESHSAINSTTPQNFSAMVFSAGVAQSGQNLTLFVDLPDGSEQIYNLPATNQSGQTGITIPPVVGENGTMVEYRLCLPIADQDSICIKGDFLIWGNP